MSKRAKFPKFNLPKFPMFSKFLKNPVFWAVCALAFLVATVVLSVLYATKKSATAYIDNLPSTIILTDSGQTGEKCEVLDNSLQLREFTYSDEIPNNQVLVDRLFCQQQSPIAEFAPKRVLIMLRPGKHILNISLGYYTQVLGLGSQKTQTTLAGSLSVPNNKKGCTGALINFYRSVRNFTVEGAADLYLSQAAPIRQMVFKGDVNLSKAEGVCGKGEGGYSSGGFLADSTVVNETTNFETQQQFCCRNVDFSSKGVEGGAWNLSFYKTNLKDSSHQCDPSIHPMYNVQEDVALPDKTVGIPNVTIGSSNNLQLEESNLNNNKRSVLFCNPSVNVATINTHLQKTDSDVVFMPGIYKFAEPVLVSQNGSRILGLGFATIEPVKGNAAVEVRGVGCLVSGLILEAGQSRSNELLLVETNGNASVGNPTTLSDIFPRVGGPTKTATADKMVWIKQNYTVVDHMWTWRADHTTNESGGLGPEFAVVNTGVLVTGDHVTALGLFAEHALEINVEWVGDYGTLHFLQTELPYDVDPGFRNPGLQVSGTNFRGDGLGIYCYFNGKKFPDPKSSSGPTVRSAITVTPEATETAAITGAFTVFLNGYGRISNVINDSGSPASSDNRGQPQYHCKFP